MATFGRKLKELRQQRKISLRSLAGELGMSPTFLSDIENERRLPPTSDKFANSIDTIQRFLGLNDEETNQLRLCADEDLFEKGLIAKDLENYMKSCPKAQVAMRKAISNNASDKEWDRIIKILEGN